MKILSVDAETNGLTGQPFTIGAIVTDDTAPGFHSYAYRCDLQGPTDPWVLANVFPAVEDIEKIPGRRYVDLLAGFAQWFDVHKYDATVIAHVGVPVEARLFRDMIWFLDRDPFSGPFPLHDLATALLMAGDDPLSADGYLLKHGLAVPSYAADMSPHNPLYDAAVAEVAWRHLMADARGGVA
jgi:hypothetical protein